MSHKTDDDEIPAFDPSKETPAGKEGAQSDDDVAMSLATPPAALGDPPAEGRTDD